MITSQAITIVSGGQSGVDRAALDAALACGLTVGGWCPKGRIAEDGVISDRYPLTETPLATYRQRTTWNVRDSDATLIVTGGPLTGGTALTVAVAKNLCRRYRVLDPRETRVAESVCDWMEEQHVATLNVAGPRESTQPGVYRASYAFLCSVFMLYTDSTHTSGNEAH